MAAPKAKFMFDADFAPGAGAAERPVAAAEHALKLVEAESKGFRDGYAAAEAERVAEAERRTALAFEQIGDGIDRLARALAEIEARLKAETVEVAVAVGRKLAPTLIAREPFEEIAALASECFKQLVASPHIAVRVHDSLQQTAREQLEAIARDRGFAGRLIVIAEPDIAVGDCRIDWADGGVVRDQASVEAAIAEAVCRYLEANRGAAASEFTEVTT